MLQKIKEDIYIMNFTESETTLTDKLIAQQKPLSHSVLESVQDYFAKLGDTFAADVYGMVLAEVEKPLLQAVMAYTKGNQSKAAIVLGLSRGTLRKKLKIYGMLD
jgi:Fis family transcriptional regulator